MSINDKAGIPQPTPCPNSEIQPLHKGTPYVKRPHPLAECGAYSAPHDDTCRRPSGHDGDHSGEWASWPQAPDATSPSTPNPKTLVGNTKVPMFSVVPATALIRMARAMQYGAFLAPRKDALQKGYSAFNWRDQDIEYMTYIDAAWRHLAAAADGEDVDPDTGDMLIGHLEEAMATIAILIDAMAHGTYINNRPTKSRGLVGQMLREYRAK